VKPYSAWILANGVMGLCASLRVRSWRLGACGVLLVMLMGHANLALAKTESASAVAASAVSAVAPEILQLQGEIEDLRALSQQKLPAQTSLSALFEINLTDEAAVEQRRLILQARLAAPKLAANPPPTATGTAALRVERDRLRLAFLSMPVEQRAALLTADRLRHEEQAIAAEQRSSVEALVTAEKARDAALNAANQAVDETRRALATEQARLLAHASEMASLRQSWAADNKAQLEQRRELLSRYPAYESGHGPSADQADALYAHIRQDLRTLRTAANAALNALSQPSSVVPFEKSPVLASESPAQQAEAANPLVMLRAQIAQEETEIRSREVAERYLDAEAVMSTLSTLQARRIALLPYLSEKRRREVTGFTDEGLARVLSEVAHVRLMVRWYPIQRSHDARSSAALLSNIFVASRFGIDLLSLCLVLIGLLLLRRRSRTALRKLRGWLPKHIASRNLMLRMDSLMQILIAVAHELIFLLAVYVFFDWAIATERAPELSMLRLLAYAFAYYALSLAFIHRVLLTAVSRYRAVNHTLNNKILGSLRLVARLILFISAYLILAQALLGRGALFGIAQDIAIVGALVISWRLIRDWRAEVTDAYLRYFPSGRLANLVRATQGKGHGLLIAAAAFIYVAARGVWIWLRDIALGFEQTRKALAYLFRRQLERQSKHQPSAPDHDLLPEALQAALTEDAAPDNLSIDHYPQLADVLLAAQSLNQGGAGGLYALIGERGAGKTTWLLELKRNAETDLPCDFYSFKTRAPDAESVCRLLCSTLHLDETDDPQHLIDQLLARPARVVLLDMGQNLMLRAVGGLAGYELFVQVAQATLSRVLWVIAFAQWPFEYLQRTHPDRDVYDEKIHLKPWSEEAISTLLDTRMEAAGFVADYDQLLLNSTVGSARYPTADVNEMAERTADRYHRLVWDYADGNPRVALHFFRLSLAWTQGNKVTVRLFPMPSGSDLEEFAARTRLLLACLFQHENLTADEAHASLRFPLAECSHTLDMLYRHGFLSCEEGVRYRVTSHWNRAVLRFLQRKKLLVV
jgi:hypothetical protein